MYKFIYGDEQASCGKVNQELVKHSLRPVIILKAYNLNQMIIKDNLLAPVPALETFQHNTAVVIRSAITQNPRAIPVTNCCHDCQVWLKSVEATCKP
jgi:hypothetical protein